MPNNVELYNRYFVENNFERLQLFELLRDTYNLTSAIYLGSFVHITPSFVFERTAFIDNDKRVQKFFDDPETTEMVIRNKQYDGEPEILASQQNYQKPIAIEEDSFDLLISQYSGPVSVFGKKFLKKGGILLVNNSHGDASLAHLDPDYELIAVSNHTKNNWRISTKDLEQYFITKKGTHPNRQEIENSMKSVDYTKTAANYIFKKIH